jgi:hypothetical protein
MDQTTFVDLLRAVVLDALVSRYGVPGAGWSDQKSTKPQ